MGLFCLSCASAPVVQPQVNSLVVAGRFNYALRVLREHQESYGENNRLLYLCDYGLVLHLTGDYGASIKMFEAAKDTYDRLYTKSVSKQIGTWLINDYSASYRGEDFERVMINIFQALNFLMLGDIDGALVEARDVDFTLKQINKQYRDNQSNVYKEDAFARLLMGILYEHKGTFESYNDAFIAYRKALNAYENDYSSNYGSEVPLILKENLLAAAKFMGDEEFNAYKKKFKGVPFLTFKEKQELAEVYLFYYHGLSPIKHQVAIPIPLPNGFFTRLAFPNYDKRHVSTQEVELLAVSKESGANISAAAQEVENIEAIAISNLKNRRARVIAKAALRSGAKFMVEDQIESRLKSRHGKSTADVFRYLASLYNISTEQADIRSWQTLPANIRVARLWLKPGTYTFYVGDRLLGSKSLKASAKEYFVIRTTR